MALRERIFSLETEYGIQFYAAEGSTRPEPETQVMTLVGVLREKYGLAAGEFLVNGSKFHHDVGHPEWALPECRSAREATVYDRAADAALQAALPEAAAQLARRGHRGQLVVFKNNVDAADNTFGCHENYLMLRDAELLGGSSFQRYLVRCLTPFLVTRQLYCGAGHLVLGRNAQPPAFHLAQRAAFIEFVVTDQTVKERAIVNLARENEPHAGARYRRLHLILGDANLSGWATWMKLGTTGLLLRLIEDLYLCDVPLLADPVGALKQTASDLSGRRPLRLRDGKTLTAVEIQWEYWRAVSAYVEHFGASAEEQALLAAWEQALRDWEQDPLRLRDRADWAIKKHLMDTQLQQAGGADWNTQPFQPGWLGILKGTEARYHDLSAEGLFMRLQAAQRRADTLVEQAELEQAQQQAPPFTRANLRGQIVRQQMHGEFAEVKLNWGEMRWGQQLIKLDDPLEFFFPADIPYEDLATNEALLLGLQASSPVVRGQAARYLGWCPTAAGVELLKELLAREQDETVLRAALLALGQQGLPEGRLLLVDYLQHPRHSLRWTAEAALQQEAEPPPAATAAPKPARAAASHDDLVRILS